LPTHFQVVPRNRLFPFDCLPPPSSCTIFMAEDYSLCTDVRHPRAHRWFMEMYADAHAISVGGKSTGNGQWAD